MKRVGKQGDTVEVRKAEFRVRAGGGGMESPHWREVELEGVNCPLCGGLMSVTPVFAQVYAHCQPCGKYFLGE